MWGACIISDRRADRLRIVEPIVSELRDGGVPVRWVPAVFYDGSQAVALSWVQRHFTPRSVIGVCIAHASALRAAEAMKLDYVLVLEDDVQTLVSDLCAEVRAILGAWTTQDMVYVCPNLLGSENDGDENDGSKNDDDDDNGDNDPSRKVSHRFTKVLPHVGLQGVIYRVASIPKILKVILPDKPVSRFLPRAHVDQLLQQAVRQSVLHAGKWVPYLVREADSILSVSGNQTNRRYDIASRALQHILHTPVLRLGNVNVCLPVIASVLAMLLAGLLVLSRNKYVYWQSAGVVLTVVSVWAAMRPRGVDAVLDVSAGLFIFITLTAVAAIAETVLDKTTKHGLSGSNQFLSGSRSQCHSSTAADSCKRSRSYCYS